MRIVLTQLVKSIGEHILIQDIFRAVVLLLPCCLKVLKSGKFTTKGGLLFG